MRTYAMSDLSPLIDYMDSGGSDGLLRTILAGQMPV